MKDLTHTDPAIIDGARVIFGDQSQICSVCVKEFYDQYQLLSKKLDGKD